MLLVLTTTDYYTCTLQRSHHGDEYQRAKFKSRFDTKCRHYNYYGTRLHSVTKMFEKLQDIYLKCNVDAASAIICHLLTKTKR